MRRNLKKTGLYLMITITAVVVGYPLLWLFFAAFKENAEIFTSVGLLPKHFTLDGFVMAGNPLRRCLFPYF